MKTLVLRIEYDGTRFGGWQVQPNAPSVQEEIEKVINKLSGRRLAVVGSGRTDSGVHARGQVAHVREIGDFPVPEIKISKALNTYLPKDIRITGATIVDYEFNARFDAVQREYSYTIGTKESVFTRNFTSIIKYPFDPGLLNQAAEVFTGRHDFTTFSKHNPSTASYVCNVSVCLWAQEEGGRWRMQISADRFVYGMVRAIAGGILDAARGKRSIEELAASLEKKDRRLGSPLAPPQGLILERVDYPPHIKIFS